MRSIGRWTGPRGSGHAKSGRTPLDAATATPRRGALEPRPAEAILNWNRRRGAPSALEAPWRTIMAGRGRVVVTGQQPALAGGPLYTLYKLLTAEALAERIARDTGEPCLAVFWIVGDDSDFGEVNSAWLPADDRAVIRLRDAAIPPAGSRIGDLSSSRQLEALAREPALCGEGPIATRVRSWMETAAGEGDSWSGLFARLVYGRIPDLEAIFVDGAHPAIVEAQSEWLRGMAGEPLSARLEEGAAEAQAAGYAPALDPELGRRAIYRLEGALREPAVAPFEAGAPLAPNVVLRPLVQDLLLPNVATVCGAAEVRYRAQLGPLYRAAGIPRPPLVPRLGAVLIPPLIDREVSSSVAADDWLSLRQPDAWIDRLALASVSGLRAGTQRVRESWRASFQAWREEAAAEEPALLQVADSAEGKIDYQFQRIEEAIQSRGRQRLFRAEAWLPRWREFVRPRDGEQERALSLLTPFLYEPASSTAAALRRAAEEHLDRLDRGEAGLEVFALEAEAARAARPAREEER